MGLLACLIGCADYPNKSNLYARDFQQENNPQLDWVKAAQLNVNLGLAYLKQGQTSRAKTKLNRAMKIAHESP